MGTEASGRLSAGGSSSPIARLRERGVLRVAASYAVIAWLLLQIASVVFEPLGVPKWVMTALIIAAAVGFPIAIALAWFLEIGEHGVQLDTAASGVPRPTARGLRHYADAIVIGVLLLAVAVLLVRQSDFAKPKPPANPAIAVLPFANLGGDPQQDYFAEGLAQEVLDRLGRVPGLTVIARSSSFSFKGKGVDPKTIAERLGVTTLLEGSVRRDGNKLKLSAELVDGASGRQVWSGTFDRELTDVFQVQEELAAAVIEAIVPAARGEAGVKSVAPTSDTNAYDLYLLGRAAQEARTGERLRESVGYLEKAIAADPRFAKAHAALSRSLYFWNMHPNVPPPEDALQRAEAEAYKALAIDQNSSEAHAALGTVMREKNPAGAEQEYRRALDLNPNNAVALWDYGALLSLDPKRERDTRQLIERVERLDPRSAILWATKLDQAADRPDGDRAFRALFGKALACFADDPDGLIQMNMAARLNGFAPEALLANLRVAATGRTLPPHTAILPWLMVDDLERAQRAADGVTQQGRDPDAALSEQFELAGLRGDFAAQARLGPRLLALRPDQAATWRRIGFWLAIQGKYAEAAQALAKGAPFPDEACCGLGAAMVGGSQLLPALLRTYRATGRSDEANRIARRYLTSVRGNPEWVMDLAALEANEGLKDEAVRSLRTALNQRHVQVLFFPQLPWFRSLEGYPAYEQLMAERRKRVAAARAQMLRLEAEAARAAPTAS